MRRTACILMLVLAGGVSFADDLNPPQWRGLPGTTFTQWEFLTDSLTPAPDLVNNPFGESEIVVSPTHPWELSWGGRDGVWALSGWLDIDIDNSPVQNPTKLVQVQLTWAGQYDSPAAVPTIEVTGMTATGLEITARQVSDLTIDLEQTGEAGADDLWHHTTYLFEMAPNPVSDTIQIGGSVRVDQLVIDTYCMPEPMTVGLMALGGLFIRKFKRA